MRISTQLAGILTWSAAPPVCFPLGLPGACAAAGSLVEVYTQEHVAMLGDCQTPWCVRKDLATSALAVYPSNQRLGFRALPH